MDAECGCAEAGPGGIVLKSAIGLAAQLDGSALQGGSTRVKIIKAGNTADHRRKCRGDGQVGGVGDVGFPAAHDVVQLRVEGVFHRATRAGEGKEARATGDLLDGEAACLEPGGKARL